MRRFFKTVSIMLLCGILACPIVEGRGRNNGNGGGGGNQPANVHNQPSRAGGASQGGGRPGNGGQRPGNSGQRPGNGGIGNNNPGNNRPGNNGGYNPGNNNFNPGNNGGPGNSGPGYNPGNGGGPGYNPNPSHHGPAHNHYGYGYNVPVGIPHRPMMPASPRPWGPPTPPAYYRPWSGPSFATILGVALGTTISYALNDLVYNGYNVTGYGNDAIYLTNCNQLNMLWPNATLYYTNGLLAGSEFVYSTPYYDMSRYNNAYNMLVGTYGMPVSSGAWGQGGFQSTWWGRNGQFIQLQFNAANAMGGDLRYYTTLSFGN